MHKVLVGRVRVERNRLEIQQRRMQVEQGRNERVHVVEGKNEPYDEHDDLVVTQRIKPFGLLVVALYVVIRSIDCGIIMRLYMGMR